MVSYLKSQWRLVALGILCSILIFLILQNIADRRVANMIESLSAAQAVLATESGQLSDQLRRGQYPQTALTRYSVCPNPKQLQFDALLGQLSNALTNAELRDLQVLFQECAYANVYQRLYTALQLENVTTQWSYLSQAEASHQLVSREVDDQEQSNRSTFVQNELAIAEEAMNLVRLQGMIIAELSVNTSATDPRIVAILAEVDTVKQTMSQLRAENASLRAVSGI